ncbi:MAG: Wzz/FepE/Etk N-terminal domain-containing protein [Devosia sp.]
MNETGSIPREVLGLLRRQYRLILATLIVVVGVATGVVFVLEPVYSAQALVMVDTSHKDLLDTDVQLFPVQDGPRIDSEVELVKADTTMQRVLTEAHLLDNPEFAVEPNLVDNLLYTLRIRQPSEPTPEDLVRAAFGKLVSMISVSRKGTTYLIAINARSRSATTAAMLANAVARAYIAEQVASKIDGVLSASAAIDARIAQANKSVVDSENAFDTFISDNIDRIATTTGRSDLLDIRRNLDAALATGSQLAATIQAGDQSIAGRNWQAAADALRDEAIAKLEADRRQVETNLAAVADGQSTNLRDELQRIESELEARTNARLQGLRGQLAQSQSTATELRQSLRSGILGANLPAETLATIYEVQQTAEIARSQYQSLLARSKDLETQAYLQIADSRIVSNALEPTVPAFPNKRLLISFAAIVGLVGGIALALLFERWVGGVTSTDQLRSVTRLTVPTAIPRQGELKRVDLTQPSTSLADYLTAEPLSSYAEAIRRLRVGLDQSARRARAVRGTTDGKTVIVVTSAAPAEGKTTTSLALARAYALSGCRTLLVDCDLRKPSLHRQLGLDPSAGLMEYLSNPASSDMDLRSFIGQDKASGAHVMVGARQSETATDQFVTGASFHRLVQAARQVFDVVILDTPPVGSVVDGLYIAESADVIAMIVRYASTSQGDIRNALLALSESKAPETEIVAVLNQVSERTASYADQYRSYYARA